MSVAGIPAFLEERQVFVRERMNGLYGPGAYVLANSIVTLPYLFLCVVLFSVICYWSIGLNPGADQFFRFLAILYLAVYAAESQVSDAAFPYCWERSDSFWQHSPQWLLLSSRSSSLPLPLQLS